MMFKRNIPLESCKGKYLFSEYDVAVLVVTVLVFSVLSLFVWLLGWDLVFWYVRPMGGEHVGGWRDLVWEMAAFAALLAVHLMIGVPLVRRVRLWLQGKQVSGGDVGG